MRPEFEAIREDLAAKLERLSVESVEQPGCRDWMGTLGDGGYGRVRVGKQMLYAHRVSVYLRDDSFEIDNYTMQAGHTCGRRRCIRHVVWQTPIENATQRSADRTNRVGSQRSGSLAPTTRSSSKLTERQVFCALVLCDEGVPVSRVAARFAVHQTTIYRLLAGRTWKHVDGPRRLSGRRSTVAAS